MNKLLISLAASLAAIVALLGILAVLAEARFRPVESTATTVIRADLGYLQGRVSEPKSWISFSLPGIANAEVSLSPGGQTTITGDDGVFMIEGIRPGVYALTLAADGFETAIVERVAIAGGRITTLPDETLFPAINGPPRARLKLGRTGPLRQPPESYPYLTTVYLDATDSANISRYGIRFEIRDDEGTLLTDPFGRNGEPLQPKKSAVPGTSPALFLFQPPHPGKYSVRLILSNGFVQGVEDAAEITVNAINTAPQALPLIIAGPRPPQKLPTGERRASSGLHVVNVGDEIYLMGMGLDRNHASPERYNPGGVQSDIYGKNHDHLQRQFGFSWQLFRVDPDTGATEPADDLLKGPDGNPASEAQIIHFTAERAGHYEASLTVSDMDPYGPLTSDAVSTSLLALEDDMTHDGTACAACHQEQVDNYTRTAHKKAAVGCESCHGPAAAHLEGAAGAEDYQDRKRANQDVNLQSGVCGQCHDEYGEWEKSRHSDGMPYGHFEIARPLLVQCAKCHYAKTFAATVATAANAGIEFHEVRYEKRVAGIGPLMPDLSKIPEPAATGVSCVACHSPHDAMAGRSVGLRTGTPGALCQTCHEEKWQNVILEGTAGIVRNGYEYPGEDYPVGNPHNTAAKCVRCHLGDQTGDVDTQGVRTVGGHTLRMRDAGADKRLGGFGPRPEDPQTDRDTANTDDVLHLAACAGCHEGIDSFDLNGMQGKTHASWVKLGELLMAANGGYLPGYKPGDKCATCHRGGTLPFNEDPSLLLENAYTNYKLIKNDRSWGIHNPKYVQKLLADSIAAVETYLATHDAPLNVQSSQ